MRTIFYLFDLSIGQFVDSYEGIDDEPPEKAKADAQALADQTEHKFVLARGKLFFEKEK